MTARRANANTSATHSSSTSSTTTTTTTTSSGSPTSTPSSNSSASLSSSFYDKARWKKDPKYPLLCGFLFIHAALLASLENIIGSVKGLRLPPTSTSSSSAQERLLIELMTKSGLSEESKSSSSSTAGEGTQETKKGEEGGESTTGATGEKKKKKKRKKKTSGVTENQTLAEQVVDIPTEKAKQAVALIIERFNEWKRVHSQHSVGEDTVIFPYLNKALSSSTSCLSIPPKHCHHLNGHKEQEQSARKIEVLLTGLLHSPSELFRKRLLEALEKFSIEQQTHYLEEENDLLPRCLHHLSPQQLGPVVPHILNDYRLYKRTLELDNSITSSASSFVSLPSSGSSSGSGSSAPSSSRLSTVQRRNLQGFSPSSAASSFSPEREEQEAILRDLTFLEDKRLAIIQFWHDLPVGKRKEITVIEHPMLVDVWARKLARETSKQDLPSLLPPPPSSPSPSPSPSPSSPSTSSSSLCTTPATTSSSSTITSATTPSSSSSSSVQLTRQATQSDEVELCLSFFDLIEDETKGSYLQLSDETTRDGRSLFEALDHFTGDLFLRAPLFQIFRRLLAPPSPSPSSESPSPSPSSSSSSAEDMLLVFELERLLRLGFRNASEIMLLIQLEKEKEEEVLKKEQRRKKNKKKREQQKKKEKLLKSKQFKEQELKDEEEEQRKQEENARLIIRTEELRKKERRRLHRKRLQLKKLIELMDELQLQHELRTADKQAINQENEEEEEEEEEEEGEEREDEDEEREDESQGRRAKASSITYSSSSSSSTRVPPAPRTLEINLDDLFNDEEEEEEEEEEITETQEARRQEEAEAERQEKGKKEEGEEEEEEEEEGLSERLQGIYKATEKVLNDHARVMAIRQFYSPSNYLQLITICQNPVDQIFALYQTRGSAVMYHKYSITHLQHALQCATLAELDGASPAEISAAFLHDIGCLLYSGDTHDQIGCEFLSQCGFTQEVTQPIRWHEEFEDEEEEGEEGKREGKGEGEEGGREGRDNEIMSYSSASASSSSVSSSPSHILLPRAPLLLPSSSSSPSPSASASASASISASPSSALALKPSRSPPSSSSSSSSSSSNKSHLLELSTPYSKEAKALIKRDRHAEEVSAPYSLEHFRGYLEQCLHRYFPKSYSPSPSSPSSPSSSSSSSSSASASPSASSSSATQTRRQ